MKPQTQAAAEDFNPNQLTAAFGAMIHLDIVTDMDVKYFVASNGNRSTPEFYNEVKAAQKEISHMEGKTFLIPEVHAVTATSIWLLASEMIGEEAADKHLSVRPLYDNFADVLIEGEAE